MNTKNPKPRGHPEKRESDGSNAEVFQKCQNHLITPEIPETAVGASSGKQYHVSRSLSEASVPCLMAVISSTGHYFRYFEVYYLLDPVFPVYLVNKRTLAEHLFWNSEVCRSRRNTLGTLGIAFTGLRGGSRLWECWRVALEIIHEEPPRH